MQQLTAHQLSQLELVKPSHSMTIDRGVTLPIEGSVNIEPAISAI